MNKTAFFTMDVESFGEINCVRATGDRRYDAFRIEHAVNDYIDLLDKYGIKGTFFTVCSSLEYVKEYLTRAVKSGHEIALHGLTHEIPALTDREKLKTELVEGKAMLENELGTEVVGYRAPCFAVNDEVLDVLKELGFKYDSSSLDISISYYRGAATFDGYDAVCDGILKKDGFYEIPPCKTKTIFGQMSVSGGAYLRLAIYPFIKHYIEKYLKKSAYYVFYCHPADIFKEKPPKLYGISARDRFFIRAGRNGFLKRTEAIIKSLIKKGYTFSTMCDYVKSDCADNFAE